MKLSLDLIALTILWFLQLLRQVPTLVFWWQIKEYRWDRMVIHLRTRQGKRFWFGPPQKVKYGLAALSLFALVDLSVGNSGVVNYVSAGLLLLVAFLPFLTLVFYTLLNLKAVLSLKRGWTRLPDWTIKAWALTLSLFLIELILLFSVVRSQEKALLAGLLVGDALLLLLSFLLIWLANLPSRIWQRQQYLRAKAHLDNFPQLVRIGITGSYGKTSTKVFLAKILAEKYQVVATPGSVNTPIGLAQVVNKRLDAETGVLIAEMGAYRPGEIKYMAELIKPKIGILTAINPQHQALFRSMAGVERAKYELIEALPPDGLAVFNADDDRVRRLGEKTTKPKRFYSIKKKADFWVTKIKVKPWLVTFDLHCPKGDQPIKAPLPGRHNLSNLLAGIIVADHLGMDLATIAQAVAKLEPPEKTLKYAGRYQGAVLIDDTWNANPDGVLAALDYLTEAWPQAAKVVVLQPMIELGRFAGQEHERVGRRLGEIKATVLLTNGNYFDDLEKGIKSSGSTRPQVGTTTAIVNRLKDGLTDNQVVLFEGKEAEKVRQTLLK